MIDKILGTQTFEDMYEFWCDFDYRYDYAVEICI